MEVIEPTVVPYDEAKAKNQISTPGQAEKTGESAKPEPPPPPG